MKTQLILIGLLAMLAANGQDIIWPSTNWIGSMPLPSPYTLEIKPNPTRTITRPYWEGHNLFCVDYEYDPSFCTIPATMPPGKPHFTAKIRVRLNGQPFGNEFTGQVIPDGGCFEDRPEDMVDKARHAPKPEPVITQSATNGFMTNIIETGILTNYLPSSVWNFKQATNIWITNIATLSTTVVTNVPGSMNAIYRRSIGTGGWFEYQEINLRGVTNLAQLCAKIGHVWKPGMPPKHQANNEELWRYCILCEKQQYHQGEWE